MPKHSISYLWSIVSNQEVLLFNISNGFWLIMIQRGSRKIALMALSHIFQAVSNMFVCLFLFGSVNTYAWCVQILSSAWKSQINCSARTGKTGSVAREIHHNYFFTLQELCSSQPYWGTAFILIVLILKEEWVNTTHVASVHFHRTRTAKTIHLTDSF